VRRLTVLCLVAGTFAPQTGSAMDLPRFPKPPDLHALPRSQPVVRPATTPREPTAAVSRDRLRTTRIVVLGVVAGAGLLVIVRARSRHTEPTETTRTQPARFLAQRRPGRVLQLDPPDRHAPETRR
jgi:hypothetical protein